MIHNQLLVLTKDLKKTMRTFPFRFRFAAGCAVEAFLLGWLERAGGRGEAARFARGPGDSSSES